MPNKNELRNRIEQLLAREEEIIERRRRIEQQELEELERRESKFRTAAADSYRSIIEPKLKLLQQYFEDALYHPPEHGEIGVIEVNRNRRYDASISLELGIDTDGSFQHFLVVYRLHILPIFMKFQSDEKLSLPLEAIDNARLSQFVDDKITYFVETYIRLKENSHYQKVCVEIDPVCNKSVDCNRATAYAVFNGKRYYFCSVKCRDAFLDEPENYD